MALDGVTMLHTFQIWILRITTHVMISKASDSESTETSESTELNLIVMTLKFGNYLFNVSPCVSLWRRLSTTLMRQDGPKLTVMSRRSQQHIGEGPDANVIRAPISADPELATMTTMTPTLQVQYLVTVLVVARLILEREVL